MKLIYTQDNFHECYLYLCDVEERLTKRLQESIAQLEKIREDIKKDADKTRKKWWNFLDKNKNDFYFCSSSLNWEYGLEEHCGKDLDRRIKTVRFLKREVQSANASQIEIDTKEING